ncbi:HTH-type transcriptional repressor AcnR [Pseudoclavibacter triregionum]|nr:HTH-type transcriptional repressor AcnR [Pseudoclavibacter triregionum]
MSQNRRRPGRPRGESGARRDILDAASALFLAHGYRGATMRAIAARAAVDVATIAHHFGSKRKLFAASFGAGVGPAELVRAAVDRPRAEIPAAIAQLVTQVWSDPRRRRPVQLVIGTALVDEGVAEACRSYLEQEVVEPIAAVIGGAEASARASVVVSLACGALVARYAIRVAGSSSEGVFRASLRDAITAVMLRDPGHRGR